jgi:NADH-quinone oxidoreductase subunit M
MSTFSLLYGYVPLLSLVIWLPIGSLFFLLLLPPNQRHIFKYIALCTTLLQGLGIGLVLTNGLANTPTEQLTWMRLDLGRLGILSIDYLVGIDGLNVGLIMLSALMLTIGVIASWNIKKYSKAYFALYLLLDTLIMGSFLALDFLLFYIFFEVALLPVYFFISVWGGPQRTQAATKFLLYTLLGTVMILMVLIGLGLSVYDPRATGLHIGLLIPEETPSIEHLKTVQTLVQAHAIPAQDIVHSLNLVLMTDAQNFIPGSIFGLLDGQSVGGQAARLVAFLGLVIGFLIKLAVVPFHSWLPDAHVEAPTPISMVLAAIMLKIGGYGLMRTAYSIFPEGAIYYASEIGALGVCTIIYASMNALAMQDLKRMVAYASVAHMGFVLLGLASATQAGVHGALFQMVSHGLIVALLFGIVGALQSRTQDRNIENYSGLIAKMPYYSIVTMVSFFAALGLPGFSSFISELLILTGVFQASLLPKWMGMAGVMGILLNATYLIWTIQRVFLGSFSLRYPSRLAALKDLNTREYILCIPLLLLIFLLGVYPQLLLDLITDSTNPLVTRIHDTGRENLDTISHWKGKAFYHTHSSSYGTKSVSSEISSPSSN